MSCHVMSCHVMSCHVMSCAVPYCTFLCFALCDMLHLLTSFSRWLLFFTYSHHYFHAIPCFPGRDYRQNPLAAENGSDEPIYDENSIINKNDIVHPSLARAVLESPKGKLATQESKGWFKSGLGKKESEFAREMLMFPLSIKNPAVSLMASRCKH
jgi:hypothetical protein